MATDSRQMTRTARPSVREIARVAGVSASTVSRVLNGHPDVAPETREAVLAQVSGSDAPPPAARPTGTGLVAAVLPELQVGYSATVLTGAAEALGEQGRRVLFCPTFRRHEREVGVLQELRDGVVDGAILIATTATNAELRDLQSIGFPFVVIDPPHPVHRSVPSVSSANTVGGQLATEHLLELGHVRIAAITGPRDWLASRSRVSGYRAALAGAGVVPDPTLVVESDGYTPSGEAAADRLLDRADPPTAIFAFNDKVALGVLRAARRRGIAVPEELSVVGFDDSEPAGIAIPALTTVAQPVAELGRMAALMLGRILDGNTYEVPSVELETHLVVRESTAPPRV